jgi:hypothetical protein
MPAEHLLQMPAVRTGRFRITGFGTYTAQGTVIKNYKKTESVVSTGHQSLYTIHSAPYIAHYTLNITHRVPHILYTIHCTQYSCLLNTFCRSAPIINFNKKMIVELLLRISLYNPLVLVGLLEFMIIQ